MSLFQYNDDSDDYDNDDDNDDDEEDDDIDTVWRLGSIRIMLTMQREIDWD